MAPTMKSASARPVIDPLKENWPLVGRLFTVSILVWIQLAPTENWCLPRIRSKSSAIWKPSELKKPGLVPAAADRRTRPTRSRP